MPRKVSRIIINTEDGLKQTKIEEYFRQTKMSKIPSQKIILPYPFSEDEDSDSEVTQRSNTDVLKNLEKTFEATSSDGINESILISSESSDDTTLNYSLTGKTAVTILENVVLSPNENKENNNNSKRKSDDRDHEDASTCSTPPKTRNTGSTSATPNSQSSSTSSQPAKFQIQNLYIIYGNNQQVNHNPPEIDMNSENFLSTPTRMRPNVSPSNTVSTSSSGKGTSPMKTSPLKGNKLSHSTPKKKLAFSPSKTPGKNGETSKTVVSSSSSKVESMAKPEDEKFNLKQLDSMKKLYENTLSNLGQRRLLKDAESKVIEEFLEMDIDSQYLLIKLFLYLPKWYHVMEFCKKIKLDQKISAKEIHRINGVLKEKKFINTDLKELGMDTLLGMTSAQNLKSLCKQYKLSIKSTKRDDLIKALKTNCRTQRNLSTRKTPQDLLKERTLEYLGIRFQLEDNIRMALHKAYLIQVFTMSNYIDPQVYFNDINHLNVQFPDFKTENYLPFLNDRQFSRFTDAVLLKKNYFDNAEKNKYDTMKILANDAFTKLTTIPTDGKCPSYFPDHLRKFSAEYQLISILTTASKKLIKFHESVKTWLEYLIEHYTSHRALGYWYKQLTHIFVRYLKNHEAAARIAIKALKFNIEKKSFNIIQIHELSSLANKIWAHKQNKLPNLLRDELSALSESPIKSDNFIKNEISGRTDRNSKIGKRVYSFIDENGDHVYGSVEMLVINHYKTRENYEGKHFEGHLLQTLFVLLFWDIIYVSYVPNTFISKLQNAPLDMFSEYFYQNRKEKIDVRLEEISQNWSQDEIESILKKNWTDHSHEACFVNMDTTTSSVEELLKMFRCIKRKVLAKIFQRMVSNYKLFRSGLPDLFLWKPETSECKFVEVKGENDKLSLKQMLWIQYLMDIEASVEVCLVTGVGAKKILPYTEADNSD